MACSQQSPKKKSDLDSSTLNTDSFDDFSWGKVREASFQERKNWIQAMEIKQEISSSMDLILKSMAKLQVDLREKMTTAASNTLSSEQSDDLQSSFDETMEFVRKTDQEIKQRLEENEVIATTMLRKSLFASGLGTSMSKIFNKHFKKPFTPREIDFQRNVVQFLRLDQQKIAADDFCNWVEVDRK